MYSFSLFYNLDAYKNMQKYYSQDNVSKIFKETLDVVRAQIRMSAMSKGKEVHFVRVWGHGIVKMLQATVTGENQHRKVSLTELS